MAIVKNTIKLIDSYSKQVSTNYNLYSNNIIDIYKTSNTPYELICNGFGFRFGYMQGMKAARAELRKGCK